MEITVYEDRSFTFILKTPPASVLLKKAAGVESGSGEPNRKKVGAVSMKQVGWWWWFGGSGARARVRESVSV